MVYRKVSRTTRPTRRQIGDRNMVKIQDCPECGTAATIRKIESVIIIECPRCRIGVATANGIDDAIDMWNGIEPPTLTD